MDEKRRSWEEYQLPTIMDIISMLAENAMRCPSEKTFRALYLFLKMCRTYQEREYFIKILAMLAPYLLAKLIEYIRRYEYDSEFADFLEHHRIAHDEHEFGLE